MLERADFFSTAGLALSAAGSTSPTSMTFWDSSTATGDRPKFDPLRSFWFSLSLSLRMSFGDWSRTGSTACWLGSSYGCTIVSLRLPVFYGWLW